MGIHMAYVVLDGDAFDSSQYIQNTRLLNLNNRNERIELSEKEREIEN